MTTSMRSLDALNSLLGQGGGTAGGTQTMFQLDAVGQAMFDEGELTSAGDGFFRLFAQGSGGKFRGHGKLQAVPTDPARLAGAQLAMVTVALTAAIKEVQEAAERVEAKVDLIRDMLDAERDGEVIGANRALRRRSEHFGFDNAMSDADWYAIDGIGVEVEQQIEQLRSFIRKRLSAAEDEGQQITGRLDAVRHARDVTATLALLIVAQDSLFLFQQLRVLRIKATQPEFVSSAVNEARALLDEHISEDTDLLQRLKALVADRVTVEALEALRFRTASEIAQLAPEVDETLAWFADQRLLAYESFEVPPLPGAAEMVDEVKERGAALASGGKHAFGALADKMRSTMGDAEDPELEPGNVPVGLPSETGDDAQVDPEQDAGRFSKFRSSAMSRIGRGGADDDVVEKDTEPDRDSSAMGEV